MSLTTFLLLAFAAYLGYACGWPALRDAWRRKRRQERLDALVAERSAVLRHRTALENFPIQNANAAEEDKAEAAVLRGQAANRVLELNREIASVHMETLRENDRKAIR